MTQLSEAIEALEAFATHIDDEDVLGGYVDTTDVRTVLDELKRRGTNPCWTMHQLDDLCKGFGFVTSDTAQATVVEFLEYIAEQCGDQERFERQFERAHKEGYEAGLWPGDHPS